MRGCMLIKIITLSFDSAYGGFNDQALRDFLKDLEVVSVRDHFFIRNEVAYLTLIIKYFPMRQELDAKLNPKGERDEAWRRVRTAFSVAAAGTTTPRTAVRPIATTIGRTTAMTTWVFAW